MDMKSKFSHTVGRSRAVSGTSEAHPAGKTRQQWQVNKELLHVHFRFVVNVAVGLNFAGKVWVLSGTISEC